MDTFAFIIHPINPKRDVSRKFPLLGKLLTEKQINFFSTFFPPVYISEIEGITSTATGKEIQGWFVACPFTPTRMLELPTQTVYRKIIQTGKLAEKLGADILGLGAYTSVVGDAGVTIAKNLNIPTTTGDAYTVAIAVEAILKAGETMEIPVQRAAAAVVGATGTIGKVCAEILADNVDTLFLIGRREAALEELRNQIIQHSTKNPKPNITIGTDISIIQNAQLVITVTSTVGAVIEPHHLQPGSVVCDVARPRDTSIRIAAARDDVLVIDGGMVDIPGPVNFNFDFGFPPGKAYACMAETMALALEGHFENYSLGKNITREQVQKIKTMADKHGFQLSGFRSFEKAVTQQHIEKIKAAARKK